MPTLPDLVRRQTDLDQRDLEWLHALVSDWQLLADLSFADLVLWVPQRREEGEAEAEWPPRTVDGWICVAQMRPTTGPTAYPDDLVGRAVRTGKRGLIDVAWRERRIVREGDPEWGSGIPVREESIPILARYGSSTTKMLGVVQRSTNLSSARTPSRLELTYLQSASDLAQMISEGRFPVPGAEANLIRSPRVGDGLLRVDRAGRVVYASPNALSAYRRLGLATDLVGVHLGETTAVLAETNAPIDESFIGMLSGKNHREVEVEAHGAFVQLRMIPLIVSGEQIGSIALIRDVTELRWRDRELMTKDATIREIHHRVKNNLQTVAALLRLQARRLRIPEGRAALEEAVRRVGSIAIVHETLSHTPDELIDFDEIADRVIAMSGEVMALETRVHPKRAGSFGVLPAAIASPIAMILTELLQNALQHGLAVRGGTLEVLVSRTEERLHVEVRDDGVGLPPDFDPESADSLGIQIVRALTEGELGGSLAFGNRETGGASVVLDLPLLGPRAPQRTG
ncbi:PAS domain-containing sensor histidine kinase [Actinocorallia sp. API 0066]|uniref:sensor histidine kinase n=1 Tax=Actinocorallia sp. API 0066 TaxID=2896846 RepID=UPI001E33A6B1|nr:PAS domain-containing sensor histidine kinase [Actinocorallia sp. API 0066]MCD0448167.1 PAS domain-containing sensor histidine kinase [Actinocorallia sp. API 0066]